MNTQELHDSELMKRVKDVVHRCNDNTAAGISAIMARNISDNSGDRHDGTNKAYLVDNELRVKHGLYVKVFKYKGELTRLVAISDELACKIEKQLSD
uniref:Uncharacterized protein n=1 Tax=Pithovirus LCDPAC01 TaxID=2506600 RepID=A0A4D5XFA1_9VIRU|nr:MAG: hypothetical protein LCDPAC01_02740 [Pithovirus LCDPAC01]